MGNPNTGEIYELAEGEQPKPGDVPLTPEEAERLKALDVEVRKVELRSIQDRLAQEKPTIAELERLIEGGVDVHLNPDGTVTLTDIPCPKPLTLRENIGGEY